MATVVAAGRPVLLSPWWVVFGSMVGDRRKRANRLLHFWRVPGSRDPGIRMGSGRFPSRCSSATGSRRPRIPSSVAPSIVTGSAGSRSRRSCSSRLLCLAVAHRLLRQPYSSRWPASSACSAGQAPLPYASVSSWFDEAPRPCTRHRDDRDWHWRDAGAAVSPGRCRGLRMARRVRRPRRVAARSRISRCRDLHPRA